MGKRDDVLFVAPSFGASVRGTHETYVQFALPSYRHAEKFCVYLDASEFHRSSITGNGSRDWWITVWVEEKD